MVNNVLLFFSLCTLNRQAMWSNCWRLSSLPVGNFTVKTLHRGSLLYTVVHVTRCVALKKSYKWHNVRLFVVGHLCKTDSWMVQFTEFLQRFMTKVSMINTHQHGTPMIILLFSTLLSLSPHSCRHGHRLMIGETWQWYWDNKHPVSVRVRGGRVPKRETCFLMVAGASFVLGQQCWLFHSLAPFTRKINKSWQQHLPCLLDCDLTS